MTKHNLSIIQYNDILNYIKNKNMNNLIEKMNDVKITHECMLCKKLKQKLGKNTLGKTIKFCKNNI
jgi:hypothetical protein